MIRIRYIMEYFMATFHFTHPHAINGLEYIFDPCQEPYIADTVVVIIERPSAIIGDW